MKAEIDYKEVKEIRRKAKRMMVDFLEESRVKYGDTFELKCEDYDCWEDAVECEGLNLSNQMPYSVFCQGFNGETYELYLTSVRLFNRAGVVQVSGYSFDEGYGFEYDVECRLYTGNLEAVADFVHLVIEESKM